MNPDRFSAIILAAGYSSRMKDFKPLLPMGEKTVIERAIDAFGQNGIKRIFVVTGHRSSEIRDALRSSGVRIVENPAYDSGMFSSVKAGVNCLDTQNTDAFFITPADICMIRPLTVRMLAAAYEKNPGKVIHPVFDSKRGHPPLIPTTLVSRILDGDTDAGLKAVLENHESMAMNVAVPDRNILIDMNRPKDYENAFRQYQNHDIPTPAECEVVLNHVHPIAKDIAAHSRLVEQIARAICQALQKTGTLLNQDIVSAAALLHDMAKGQKDHANKGAAMLSEMGFTRVAKIVAQHVDLDFTPETNINESEILYLADKLAMNDHLTTLEKRFENALIRFGHDPETKRAILRRKTTTLAIKAKLENTLGTTVEAVVLEW